MRHHHIPSLLTALTCAFLALSAVQAQAASATGTWTWEVPARQGGDPRKMTLKLKAEGEKLTGTVASPGRQGAEPRETAIADGKVQGDDISFTVTREYNGNKMVQKYNGKVSADAIKGKVEFERNGEKQSRDWEAKRAEEKK